MRTGPASYVTCGRAWRAAVAAAMVSFGLAGAAVAQSTDASIIGQVTDDAEVFAADNTWEWQARASGSYLLPLGVHVSANFEHRSGTPYARTAVFRGGVRVPTITLRVEPIGSQRLPSINILHVRTEKRVRLPRSQVLSLGMNVYNATNSQVATAITATSGPNFGVVTGRLLQRYIEFQANYRF